jgi:uncharacterized protein (DUF885 family)
MLIEMKADRKADKENLKEMMKSTQETIKANTKSLREDIRTGQVEIRFIVVAFQEMTYASIVNRKNDWKDRMSCQETTEAHLE